MTSDLQNHAVYLVNKAVTAGDLVRQPCEVCGAEPADGHHDDYAKPLEVRWLCRAHHRQHHARTNPSHARRYKDRALTESLRVRLSKEQLEQLQQIAERDDRSVGAVARRAINDLLSKNGKETQ